jgi:DNA-binding transcriptional LysR family regulator
MVNNLGLMRLLAERGMGIAVLAPPLVRETVARERLVQVLPEWGVPRLPIQAVMSSRLQPASVVREKSAEQRRVLYESTA